MFVEWTGQLRVQKGNVTVVVENKNRSVATLYFVAVEYVLGPLHSTTLLLITLPATRICPAPGRGPRSMPTCGGRVPSLYRRYYYYRDLYRCRVWCFRRVHDARIVPLNVLKGEPVQNNAPRNRLTLVPPHESGVLDRWSTGFRLFGTRYPSPND